MARYGTFERTLGLAELVAEDVERRRRGSHISDHVDKSVPRLTDALCTLIFLRVISHV
jgi:hypothetical protein